MMVLAIETSTLQGSAALVDGSGLKASRQWRGPSSHSETLTAEIEELLHESLLSPHQLSALAVDIGPGSFTGIRVGVNAARALAYALDRPLMGVSSLEVLAETGLASLSHSTNLLCVMDAGQGSFFGARFVLGQNCWQSSSGPEIWSRAELLAQLDRSSALAGSGFEGLTEELKRLGVQCLHLAPTAAALAEIVRRASPSTPTFEWNQGLPLYVKASAAEEKLKNQTVTE